MVRCAVESEEEVLYVRMGSPEAAETLKPTSPCTTPIWNTTLTCARVFDVSAL
jgi:hypothetical protein